MDSLKNEEVNFSVCCVTRLQKEFWTEKIFRDSKINRAITCEKDSSRSSSSINEIKGVLFEVRFAYAIHLAGKEALYEYRTGIGGSSVDFKVEHNESNWLIELTSLRESEAVKDHSFNNDVYYGCIDIQDSDSRENGLETRDLVKTQNAICHKVFNDKHLQPIKFPEIKENQYHMIIIDMRDFCVSGTSHYKGIPADELIIAYGSESLSKVDHGFHCRYWFEKDKNYCEHIQGLFDNRHPHLENKFIRDRIHILGFINEQKYIDNEIIDDMYFFCNPKYFKNRDEMLAIFPFAIEQDHVFI